MKNSSFRLIVATLGVIFSVASAQAQRVKNTSTTTSSSTSTNSTVTLISNK